MKLTKLHLFLIVLVVLVASTLGFSIKEYYENNKDRASENNEEVNEALEKGSKHDPFSNKKKHKKKKNSSDPFMRDYDCTIADLEDKVNPEREKRMRWPPTLLHRGLCNGKSRWGCRIYLVERDGEAAATPQNFPAQH